MGDRVGVGEAGGGVGSSGGGVGVGVGDGEGVRLGGGVGLEVGHWEGQGGGQGGGGGVPKKIALAPGKEKLILSLTYWATLYKERKKVPRAKARIINSPKVRKIFFILVLILFLSSLINTKLTTSKAVHKEKCSL